MSSPGASPQSPRYSASPSPDPPRQSPEYNPENEQEYYTENDQEYYTESDQEYNPENEQEYNAENNREYNAENEQEYDAAYDLFLPQEPEEQAPQPTTNPGEDPSEDTNDPVYYSHLAAAARDLAHERDEHQNTLATVTAQNGVIRTLRADKRDLELKAAELREDIRGYREQEQFLKEDSREMRAEINELERVLGARRRNQSDAETQTEAITVDITDEVDNTLLTRPNDATAAAGTPVAPPAAATTPAAAGAPALATSQYCSVCLRSVQKIPPSTMRKHLKDCGVTSEDCVSLTAAQVKSQRKARRASKASSAGKKRSAGEDPVSSRLRKRVRQA